MAKQLDGKKVAILLTDGFEQVEMTEPRRALEEAGAETVLVSPKDGRVKGWQHTDWGDEFPVDRPLALRARGRLRRAPHRGRDEPRPPPISDR